MEWTGVVGSLTRSHLLHHHCLHWSVYFTLCEKSCIEVMAISSFKYQSALKHKMSFCLGWYLPTLLWGFREDQLSTASSSVPSLNFPWKAGQIPELAWLIEKEFQYWEPWEMQLEPHTASACSENMILWVRLRCSCAQTAEEQTFVNVLVTQILCNEESVPSNSVKSAASIFLQWLFHVQKLS